MNAFPFHEDTADEDRPIQVFNVRYLSGRRRTATGDDDGVPRDRAGTVLLAASSVLLLALAVAQGYVSYRAQYSFVHAIKRESAASVLESLGLDCAAVIFALLALAQARLGRPALTERVLNLACVCGSLVMNAMSANFTDPKSVAVWTLPAALYAAASDRLIAVVRRRALAARDGDDRSPLAAVGGLALWMLRFALAPRSTAKGFRAWVLASAPVAPGQHAPALPVADRIALPAATDTHADTGADNRPATTPATNTAGTPDGGPDTARPPRRTSRATTTGRRSGRKTGRKAARPADREADALALLSAEPDLTGAELGRRLRVSERTGRRLHARVSALLTNSPDATTTTTAPAAVTAEGDAE